MLGPRKDLLYDVLVHTADGSLASLRATDVAADSESADPVSVAAVVRHSCFDTQGMKDVVKPVAAAYQDLEEVAEALESAFVFEELRYSDQETILQANTAELSVGAEWTILNSPCSRSTGNLAKEALRASPMASATKTWRSGSLLKTPMISLVALRTRFLWRRRTLRF